MRITALMLSALLFGCGGRAPDQAPPLPDQASTYRAVAAFPHLPAFSELVFVANDRVSDKLYAVQKAGIISVFTSRPDADHADVWLDIRSKVLNGGERGLLGLAFDPAFASNGVFYVHYSGLPDGKTVVERYHLLPDGSAADAASAVPVLSLPQPYPNHNGGMIEFGPDGYLYIGLGDGGASNDPHDYGQNLTVWYGKVLRVRPLLDGEGYSVPADNPFVGIGADAKPEIWAYGLRNPWRFSFDKQTGYLWLADVGQDAWEEVNIITRGSNYGWKPCEGLHQRGSQDAECAALVNASILPVVEHGHQDGWHSITGGYIYRGSKLTGLIGKYVYGDFVSGEVWSIDYANGHVRANTAISHIPSRLSSFGEDRDGELYALSLDGQIYRFEVE